MCVQHAMHFSYFIIVGIIFQIKKVDLDDGNILYCMWIARDPADPGEGGRNTSCITLASSFSSTFNASASGVSLGEVSNYLKSTKLIFVCLK